MLTREPAVAGAFYPADPDTLQQAIRRLLEQAEGNSISVASIKALIVPHAGYIYSGALAAQAYALLQNQRNRIKTVVLLGPAHRVYFHGIAVPAEDAFKTPLGTIPVNQAVLKQLIEKYPFVQYVAESHRDEHSLEVQLPFLQGVLEEFSLVPLVIGDARPEQVEKVLDYLWDDDATLFVISSDLSHFHDYSTAQSIDAETATVIESLQPDRLSGERACGYLGISGLLLAARKRQISAVRIGLYNSGDTAGDRNRVVGYGAWAFQEKKSPQQELSDEQKDELKRLALASIRHGLQTGQPISVAEYIHSNKATENLPDYPAAVFVTLKKDGQLRGCIGSLEAHRPLAQDVAENAFSAAFRDYRFAALTGDELDDLEVSISVLTPPEPIKFSSETDLLSQLQPGVDGMILTEGANRGTFLPSVWQELPQPAEFLAHLKMKAGLPADYWSGTIQAERYKTVSW